jgi:hypothetical protein
VLKAINDTPNIVAKRDWGMVEISTAGRARRNVLCLSWPV